jgi:hypothetical protein
MQALKFNCPQTGRMIDTGICTDQGTLASVRPLKLRLACPHCDKTHAFPIASAQLSHAAQMRLIGFA